MNKLTCDSNPILKKLFFDLEKAQMEGGQIDFIMMEGDTLRAIIDGIDKAFGPLANEIVCDVGKNAGKDYGARLIEKGVKPEEVPDWLSEFFTYCGWGRIHFQDAHEKKEVIISVENCVTARNAKSEQPLCHFMEGYFSGVYEAVWNYVPDCTEVLCTAKGDPFCEFKVFKAI